MPAVEFRSTARDGHAVVALRGELDLTGVAAVETAIMSLMARGQSLIIDMSALDFIDCSSLSAVLRIRESTRRGGGDVILATPQPHIRRLLALTGKDAVFRVEASVEAAVAGLAGSRRRYPWRRLAVRTACSRRAAPSRTGTG